MTTEEPEPTSAEAIAGWIARRTLEQDRFRAIYDATEAHRGEHGCEAYPSSDGPFFGVLARALGAARVLEVGTGLGYGAAWLAFGAGTGRIDTIESDTVHAELAARALAVAGLAERVTVHTASFPGCAAQLAPGYDLGVYDAAIPTPADLDALHGLLRVGGTLVTSNLFLGQYDPSMPGLEEGARVRRMLFDESRWLTTFAGQKALSVKL